MAPRADQNGEPRTPLTRESVLRAAIALADAEGIEALTMRRLGRELGVEAMSLYNHIANKDDLLRASAEMVFEQVVLPSPEDDWKAALRTTAMSAHDVLWRHRWAYSIAITPSNLSLARLGWMEAVLRTLREGGFSPELSCRAYHTLDSHITGFTLWLATIPVLGEELRALAADFLRTFPVDDYPYAAEHIQQHIAPPRPDDKGTFVFGLDLILDGLERMRDGG